MVRQTSTQQPQWVVARCNHRQMHTYSSMSRAMQKHNYKHNYITALSCIFPNKWVVPYFDTQLQNQTIQYSSSKYAKMYIEQAHQIQGRIITNLNLGIHCLQKFKDSTVQCCHLRIKVSKLVYIQYPHIYSMTIPPPKQHWDHPDHWFSLYL